MNSTPPPPVLAMGLAAQNPTTPDPENNPTPAKPPAVPFPHVGVVAHTVQNGPSFQHAVMRSGAGQQQIGRHRPPTHLKPIRTGAKLGRRVEGTGSLIKTTRRRNHGPARKQEALQPAAASAGEINLDGSANLVDVESHRVPKTEQDDPEALDRNEDLEHSEASDPTPTTKDKKVTDAVNPLECLLCGDDTKSDVTRLRGRVLQKFMKLPVPDNPFVGLEPENPPLTLALCRKDKVWIHNLWVKGRRFDISGIWTRRNMRKGGFAKARSGYGRSNKVSNMKKERQSGDASIVETLAKAEIEEAIPASQGKIEPRISISRTPKSIGVDADREPEEKPAQRAKETIVFKLAEVHSGRPKPGSSATRDRRPTAATDQPTLAAGPRCEGAGAHLSRQMPR